MNEFLLVSCRRPGFAEDLSPAGIGRSVVALTQWHGLLSRWGLLRAFTMPGEVAELPCACLVVRASGELVARRLGRRWSQLRGCDVTVLPLVDATRPAGKT